MFNCKFYYITILIFKLYCLFIILLIPAVIFTIALFGVFILAAKNTVVFEKRLKRIEMFSTLFLNFGRKQMAFGEVSAVSVRKIEGRMAPSYSIYLVGPREKLHLISSGFSNEQKALDFADIVSRTIATKITYGGFWGFGRTGPER